MGDGNRTNTKPQISWDGVISLDKIQEGAEKQREKNTYSWIDPNYVLRLVEIARRTDYYKAQYDSLMESWNDLQAEVEALRCSSCAVITKQEIDRRKAAEAEVEKLRRPLMDIAEASVEYRRDGHDFAHHVLDIDGNYMGHAAPYLQRIARKALEGTS